MSKNSEKFDFNIPFQWEIIRFTIKDKHGYKALMLYQFAYFDLIDQQIVARSLINFFKLKRRIPASAAVLNEELKKLFRSKDYAQQLLEKDRLRIQKKVRMLYKHPCKDGDEIIEKCKLFASFVEFKNALENVDINNFSQYELYSKKIQKAVNIGIQVDDKLGKFMVSAHRDRFVDRRNRDELTPTPFDQLNKLTNAGGWEKGSLVVVVDKPKKGKTMALINVARGYIGRRGKVGNKKAIFFDFENGETAIETRVDQSIGNMSKMDVMSGQFDQKLSKIYRAYSRMGGEIFIKRMSAGETTNDCQRVLDEIYQEYGIRFQVAIFDYIGIMGATSGKKEDFERIGDAYLDVKNFLKKNDFDIGFTGHHVVRGAYKKRESKYDTSDLAKCIDIERHVDAIFGIQQNEQEAQFNIWRWEILAMRDGLSIGRAIFSVNIKNQRMVELSQEKLNDYYAMMGENLEHESVEHIDGNDKKKANAKSDL